MTRPDECGGKQVSHPRRAGASPGVPVPSREVGAVFRARRLAEATRHRAGTLRLRARRMWKDWRLAGGELVDPAADREHFRAPVDLAVNPTPPGRVLVLGQCLMSWVPEMVRVWGEPFEVDHLLFANHSALPEKPPNDPSSYAFQLLQIPMRELMVEQEYFRLPADDLEAWEHFFDACVSRLEARLDTGLQYYRRFGITTFVTNFLLPQQNPMGRLLPRDKRNLVHFVRCLNDRLDEMIKELPGAYVLDVDEVAADLGRKHIQDDVLLQHSHGAMIGFNHLLDQDRIEPPAPFRQHYSVRTDEFKKAVWKELLALYRTILGIDKVKLVIVDLDDTLWRGVVAERGEVVHETTEGWPLGVAEALTFLKRRGVLLAIVSKNDPGRVEALWDTIFKGRLSLDDFAMRRMEWGPKVFEVEKVLKTVNVLPQHAVYVDDNPAERAAVRAAFPDIRVLGTSIYFLRRILLWAPETQVAEVTVESAQRTEMVRAQVDREAIRSQVTRKEFLAELKLEVRPLEISSVSRGRFGRALELLNKTNQFNTTGRRWSEGEAKAYFEAGGRWLTFEVEDRFAVYGLVVVAALRTEGHKAIIDQVVMSCRVFGLGVEDEVLSALRHRAVELGCDVVIGCLVETEANGPSRGLYRAAGFTEVDPGRWEAELAQTALGAK